MRDFLEVFVIVGVITVTVLFAVFGIAIGIDYLDCNGFASTGYQTKWTWGCYANVDGKWVPKQYVYGNAHEVRVK